MSEHSGFPPDFLWGAATAAYQIEGSPLADGAGASIWHRFSHTPGRTANGDTGDVACDHYYRYASDIDLMRELGLQAYRLSIAWGRIYPEGKGRINQAGLDFYSRLTDKLLEAGIIPNVTLYHWDLPAALDDRGGWLNPDIAEWFGDYAATMFNALADRVPMWATINEPLVVMDGGYMNGNLAPGHRNMYEAPIVTHNLLRAHGRGVQAFRARNARDSRIGLVVNLDRKYPASDSRQDEEAVARAHAYGNEQYLDPVLLGKYPAKLREIFGDAWPDWPDEDFALIKQPLDYVGVNYYTRLVVKHDETHPPINVGVEPQVDALHTEMGWEVFPLALTHILTWLKERYGDIPLYITENGSAFMDPPEAIDGRIEDPLRAEYLRRHLHAIRDAIQQGVNLRGYFAWSLLDNYEWSHGYTKRFGIVHVNYATQERTIKDSGRYYSRIIESNGAALD
ncbi:MAG TPA: GH1 family beta-glucosidase [Gemmatimonadaceae bacterium]|nr:GH1 family beta-glucosidase [Gemmatimonadaceae bacterium]